MDTIEQQETPAEIGVADESPPLPADQIQMIVQSIDVLRNKLDRNSALPTELEHIIREHLRTGVSPETVDKIFSGLSLYLDTDTVVFLLDNLRRSSEPEFLEQIKIHSPQPLWNWLRRLVALYAHDFREAYSAYTESPNAWEMMNRHTYYDALIDRWTIALEIIKYNGEKLALEETPASALGLVNGIVDALNNVPPDIAPILVEKDYIAETAGHLVALINLYAPGLLEELTETEDEALPEPVAP